MKTMTGCTIALALVALSRIAPAAVVEPKWEGVEKPFTVESPCAFGYSAKVPDNGCDQILNYCRRMQMNDPGEVVQLLRPGKYILAVSVGSRYGKPVVALPLKDGKDRVYPIGTIEVVP